MTAPLTSGFSIDEFLREERNKDLLRFSTAGSVDDGKSTLIGRLLYDTQSVYEDQVRSIRGKGTTAPGEIDFALLTDGLRAEREQGITIDVAYRYFSTARRKFIIADTPGHEQYTRNMATGASTADAAVVLIDASKGVLPQSRRHAYIASLLRVSHVVVAVNKMDLIGYNHAPFRTIASDFQSVLTQIAADTHNPVTVTFIPVSALVGDNIVHLSDAMPWYTGPSLLETLESLPSAEDRRTAAFRFPVQRVSRPDHTFRGLTGQIASGTIRPGDAITALPSGRTAHVARIVTFDGDLAEAHASLSVTLVLDRELDISRGDLLVTPFAPATVSSHLTAALVWMDQRPLQLHRRYLLKHTSQTTPAFITALHHRTEIANLAHEPAVSLEMNGIGVVAINLLRPIALDLYRNHRATGAFILIDAESHRTVAAGMVTATDAALAQASKEIRGPVTADERAARWGHRGAVLSLTGPVAAIESIERSLFTVGIASTRIDADDEVFIQHPQMLPLITSLNTRSGLLSLVVRFNDTDQLTAHAEGHEITLDGGDTAKALSAIHEFLHTAAIFISSEKAGL